MTESDSSSCRSLAQSHSLCQSELEKKVVHCGWVGHCDESGSVLQTGHTLSPYQHFGGHRISFQHSSALRLPVMMINLSFLDATPYHNTASTKWCSTLPCFLWIQLGVALIKKIFKMNKKWIVLNMLFKKIDW